MKRLLALMALAGLVVLAGCGAADPPSVEGGMDLSDFWNG